MSFRRVRACLAALTIIGSCLAIVPFRAKAQGLQVTFGANGLETLSYGGRVLEDIARWPDDSFHIWHMKSFDQAGHPLTSGQYGWGENHIRRSWDAADKSWTYLFQWGSIHVQYRPHGDVLDLLLTETNRVGSGVIFDGASVYPLALHLNRVPKDFGGAGDSRLMGNTEQPGLIAADFGDGEVVSAAPDGKTPLYSGFQAVGKEFTYAPLLSSAVPDGFARGSHPSRALKPGETATFLLSLRFAPSGTPVQKIAADVVQQWTASYPYELRWPDRRVIGTAFLAGSPQGEKTKAGGFPQNPRRYFNDAGVEIRSPAGLEAFQRRLLKEAGEVAENLKRMHAQGVITWDIEGEQYPQDTSYVCAPDQIAKVAPEMESVVHDPTSRYVGVKLDDAYFRTIRDAGFRVGVCIRPQRFELRADGTARQISLPDHEVAGELLRKMKFARERWGATLFYVDSTVDQDGATLPASVLEQVAAAMPDALILPEESTPRMARVTAPFRSFLFHGDLGTEAAVRAIYPQAFSANLINDVDAGKLSAHRSELLESVQQGDILMVLATYWQANNPTVVDLYREAARSK